MKTLNKHNNVETMDIESDNCKPQSQCLSEQSELAQKYWYICI